MLKRKAKKRDMSLFTFSGRAQQTKHAALVCETLKNVVFHAFSSKQKKLLFFSI